MRWGVTMNEAQNHNLDQILADAEKWRMLTDLLRAKAYNPMSPEDISRQFPDLRRLYREVNPGPNGHDRCALRPGVARE